METPDNRRERVYAAYDEAAQDSAFAAEMTELDDRPVAGFTNANDQPEVQAAIRARDAQDSDLAELRKPIGQRMAERDGGPKPRRVVIDACHYRSLQNFIRAVLECRGTGENRIPDWKLADRGVALASYLASSFDLDIFGKDLPTLDSYHCIECGRKSDSRLCASCYVASKT